MILYISVVSVIIHLFSLLILLFWVFFFSWRICPKVYQLCLAFQIISFQFYSSFLLFCFSPFCFGSGFDDFFPSTNFGFCFSSFSSCFKCKVELFVVFLVSCYNILLLYASLLQLLLVPPIGLGHAFSFCLQVYFYLFIFLISPGIIGCLVGYCLVSMS